MASPAGYPLAPASVDEDLPGGIPPLRLGVAASDVLLQVVPTVSDDVGTAVSASGQGVE